MTPLPRPRPIWKTCIICDGTFLAEWGRKPKGSWCISELCCLCEGELRKKAKKSK